MGLCMGSKTTIQEISNEQKTKALGENLTSVESVKSLEAKMQLLQRGDMKVVSMCSKKDENLQRGLLCRTALRTLFQHPTNMYMCK